VRRGDKSAEVWRSSETGAAASRRGGGDKAAERGYASMGGAMASAAARLGEGVREGTGASVYDGAFTYTRNTFAGCE